MFLLPIILTVTQQSQFSNTVTQGREKKTKIFETAVIVSKESHCQPWKKNVLKPTYNLITADPLVMKLVLSYRDASRLAMRTLAKLVKATALDIKRKSGSFDKDSKFYKAITRLQTVVSESDPRKISDTMKALRVFAQQPWWRKPPKELSYLTNETSNAWKEFSVLMESLWGSLYSGDEGWFLSYSQEKKVSNKRLLKETDEGVRRALLPRIGDALYFYSPGNPLPKWGNLEAFGKNGCVNSPKLLKSALIELSRHIIKGEPDFESQQSVSRYSLWRLFLKELSDPEFQFIKEKMGCFASDQRVMEKMMEARIQSVLGLSVIMRDVARNSLIIGRLRGATRTPSKIYCLLMMSKDVEEALASATESLKHSTKMGKGVVDALKKIKWVRWELDGLLSGWDELDERLINFKGYLDAIQKIRGIAKENQWKAVNKRGLLWDLVESVSSLDFIPSRPNIISNLAGRDARGVSELVPKNSWLRTFFKVEPWPHK
ncbi:MAG TPA: hypothetical protein ENK02_10545, partial [Planctomycetes bacterium]|nr:hypothetical protein [Planctomycetota bacterium]